MTEPGLSLPGILPVSMPKPEAIRRRTGGPLHTPGAAMLSSFRISATWLRTPAFSNIRLT